MTAAPAHVDAAKKAATSSEYLMEQWSMKDAVVTRTAT